MTNLGILYQFEVRKILRRKIVWISMVLMTIITVISVSSILIGSYYVDGVKVDTHYHMFQVDSAYAKELSGRAIDRELFEEIKAAYDKIPKDAGDKYNWTEEYQTYARPYSAVYNYIRRNTDMTLAEILEWEMDEQDMYDKRQRMLQENWRYYLLTSEEKEYWRMQEEKMENPVVFQYAEGYNNLLAGAYSVGLSVLVIIAVCLSGIFPEEHVRKTDQQILSSKYGRDVIYRAKLLAGLSFGACVSLLFTILTIITGFLLYGMDGFGAPVQMIYPEGSSTLSAGAMMLIAYGKIIVAGIFVSMIVMVLSEALHSTIGTLSIVMGVIILSMFLRVPVDQYRIWSQLWSYLPCEYVAAWNIDMVNPRTVPLFGRFFMSWQVGPVVYGILGVILAFLGKRRFNGYQVSGR